MGQQSKHNIPPRTSQNMRVPYCNNEISTISINSDAMGGDMELREYSPNHSDGPKVELVIDGLIADSISVCIHPSKIGKALVIEVINKT